MSRSITILVSNRDGAATLRGCVAALQARAGLAPARVVVVDHGSRDGSLEIARSLAGVEVIAAGDGNVAAALNRAVRSHAGGDDLLRVRSDVIVRSDGFLRRIAAAADERPDAAVFGVRLLHADGRVRAVGRCIVSGLGTHPRHANLGQFQPAAPASGLTEVDAVSGAFAFYRREVFDAVGGLDEGFGCGRGDDDDFCLAARQRGHAVLVDRGIDAWELAAQWSPTTRIADRELFERLRPTQKTEAVVRHAQAPYFTAKWGFDQRYPDLDEVRRLYGHTALCWRIGEPMRFRPSCRQPPVDVVLVTWNNRDLLARCLKSVARTRYPAMTVHVTDNGSSDGTGALLEQLAADFPFPLRVHRLPVNSGVAVGFNWGIVSGEAELVARLDDDVVVPVDWLEKLVETMHRRPFAGCVGPKIVNDDARRTIQCGPFRMFPGTWGHSDEEDRGQADYVARTVHVRGCCNLYRRDVLSACGLFDLRYSPSQWDDPDHHAALGAAGYEVIYDGRVAVVHALTTGKGRTWPAVSNQDANAAKLEGKWGDDVWQVLDTALDLSHLGRLLPPAAAAADVADRRPDAAAFPRRLPPPSAAADSVAKYLRYDRMVLDPRGVLRPLWDDAVELARACRRDGNPRAAAVILHGLVDLLPAWTEAIVELARCYADLAQPEEVERWRELLEALGATAAAAAAAELAETASRPRPAGEAGDRMHLVGESAPARTRPAPAGSARRLRVLMTNTYMGRCAGGDMLQVKKTKEYLERRGVEVEVAHRPHPDPTGFDVVHAFNLWFPAQVLPQVRGIRAAAPGTPIVLTPIYWSMAEKNWAERAIPLLFREAKSDAHLADLLARLADGSLEVNGLRRDQAEAGAYAAFEDCQRQILRTVDHLLPQSRVEQALIEQRLGGDLPHTVVRNAVEHRVFAAADPSWFRQRTGLDEFVLTVGLLEVRKNQLLLLQALRGTGLPVVVVGRCYDPSYRRACMQVAGADVLFIDHLPHEELASALRAARVFALPSWMECAAFASLEAAAAGCSLVVGDRTSEREYFGDAAYYADPAGVDSIRGAVLAAWNNHAADAPRRLRLQEKCRIEYTWEQVAERTLGVYRAVAEGRRIAAPELDGALAAVQ